MQEDAIRRLAKSYGDEDVTILSDLDVSGRKGRSARRGWDELLRAVESGEATAVYGYSLSRFARSVSQLADFFDLCERQHVAIHVDRDHIDTSTATGKLVGNVLASLAQFEADVASERVRDAFAVKRANDPTWRGPGQPGYGGRDGEDVRQVVDAFRRAGSFDAAARALNAQGVPCRVKDAVWSGSVVAAIVRRHAPDDVAPAVTRGVAAGKSTFRFSRLLVCSECSHYLTGSRDSRRGDTRYACTRARTTPHGRGWVNESRLLPVIVAEWEHTIPRLRLEQVGSAEDEDKARSLAAERERVTLMFRKRYIDEQTLDRHMAEIATAESRLSARRWVKRHDFPPDIANDDPAVVNRYLRGLWANVTVDMSQRASRGPSHWTPTIAVEWRDLDLRADDADDTFDGLHPIEELA